MEKAQQEAEITKGDLRQLFQAVAQEIKRRPPVIGLVGVSGVGKSSTINTLFKTSLATSDTVACTKAFSLNEVRASISQGGYTTTAVLHVVDAPGLGEDVHRDPDYLSMYKTHLPDCDVILWILTARNRAVALDQTYLRQLSSLHERIVFGLNQVDLVEPLDWDHRINLPSDRQMANLEVIVPDRSEKLSSVLGREVRVIPYAARFRYNLQELFFAILASCPADRAWIFNTIKGFRYDDFVPDQLRELIAGKIDASESPSPSPEPQSEADPSAASALSRKLRTYISRFIDAVSDIAAKVLSLFNLTKGERNGRRNK